MTPVTLLRAAQLDVRSGAQYYEAQAPGLGVEFVGEVERSLGRLGIHPELGAPLRRGARKLLVRRFPYLVIYQVEQAQVLVLAVGHQRRHPDFWQRRL